MASSSYASAQNALLKTKLYIPPIRSEIVSRPRLIERLEQSLDSGCRLVLVSAPAGFGKTTLLSECVATCDLPVAWVSLDEGDNDIVRFWSYIVAALQTVQPDIGMAAMSVFQDSRGGPSVAQPGLQTAADQAETVVTGLINELVSLSPESIVLVLDDLHVITEQHIHDALVLFLDHLPPNVHLVLSTRSDPPWPLARFRARRDVTELRTEDLRFTREEAAAFLNDVAGLDLSGAQIDALDMRAEGWIAGLQMAVLSMQDRDPDGTSAFIRAFSGSHRFILDYLMEEVLGQLPTETQEFLLKTSVLERLTAPLCDAIVNGKTGGDQGEDSKGPDLAGRLRGDSQEILERLDRANLFLVQLDDDRHWYRYHRLFADLLRARLSRDYPNQATELRRLASEWHERQGILAEAVSYAFAAGDVERVARLVEGNASAMLDYGELRTLLGWLDNLPHQVVRVRPWLCVAYAWAQAYTGQLDAVEGHLQDAEEALKRVSWQAEALHHVRGHLSAIRAYLAEMRGEMDLVPRLARDALGLLPDDDLRTRSFVRAMLGTMLYRQGDLEGAAQAYREAIDLSQKAGDSRMVVHALCDLAHLHTVKGRLYDAAAACRQAIELAGQHAHREGRWLPGVEYAYARLSSVLGEWNRLDEALHYAQEGVRLAERRGQGDNLWISYVALAFALSRLGDCDGALTTLKKARGTQAGQSYHVAYTDLYEMMLRIRQGDLAAVARWVKECGLSAEDEITLGQRYRYEVLARSLVALDRLKEALDLLERLLELTESKQETGSAIGILVEKAIVLWKQGKHESALSSFGRALGLAEPEGFVRTFVSSSDEVEALLKGAMRKGASAAYVHKLLAALEQERDAHAAPKVDRPSQDMLVEPLSERELEVLRLLPADLTSTEIAQELYVSKNTVRTHISHIYEKLGVHSREDAVQRAEEMGLL